uniref:TAFH domain-containing protein n=1 Tax=Nothobranchius furzeri TaxID=105023 RepID=A0A8C6PUX2_NOTFU
MTSDSFPECLVTRRRRMAGDSDPLEDMLFSEVDEKAVSDLVGSLESQLSGQSSSAGKADGNGGAGSADPANHHLGKPPPAPLSTTTLEQQQGQLNKPEMRQEMNSKDASPDKTVTAPSPASATVFGEAPTTSVNVASSETSVEKNTRNSNTAVGENVSSPDTTPSNSTRPVTSSINTSTFTLSNASLPVGQAAIALDRGTPTIALHRLPSHIVASIAQNGNGTTVSALAQQGARPGATISSASQEEHNDCQSKIVMSSQSGSVSSVINSVSSASSAAVTPATTSTAAPTTTTTTTTTTVSPPLIPATSRGNDVFVPSLILVRCWSSGMVLMRTEVGQLVMVPQQAFAQGQAPAQAQNNISLRPAGPTSGVAFRVTTPQVRISRLNGKWPVFDIAPSRVLEPPKAPEMQENVKKCKNFLATLIKLASHNSPFPETSKNVKALVQDLLDAKIEPEEFTSRLQTELKSSPQPYLVPFLKKRTFSLTHLCSILLYVHRSMYVVIKLLSRPNILYIYIYNLFSLGVKTGGTVGGQVRMPMVITQSIRPQAIIQAGRSPMGLPVQISANQKNKLNDPGGGSFRDDDDINDVASMAGVNLNEESARILATNSELVGTQIRSCKDEAFLHPGLLHRRILETAKKFGVTEVSTEAVTFISHATQSRLRTLVEKVSIIAQHRLDSCKDDECYEQSGDVRSQLRFFEQLERMEKQRKDEQEREILLKAAKSRSRQEDPEQARLKQKAKEWQLQEQAEIRQRDANLTALAAIGPRKKRKLDSPGTTPTGAEVPSSAAGSPAGSSSLTSSSRQYARQRITRVNLRDLIFYMEQERETAHSLLLYRALLK